MVFEASNHQLRLGKCEELAALIDRHTNPGKNVIQPTQIDALEFIRDDGTVTAIPSCTEPIFAMVVQGKKEVLVGDESYRYIATQYLVISVDLPMTGFAIDATPDRPYLAFKLNLDPLQLCDIIARANLEISQKDSVLGWFISDADSLLIDCALRLTRLLDTPQDLPFLAPIVIREIYYRLLVGDRSEAVRQIATSGSTMQRIAAAIQQLKTDFTKPLRIDELAERANMSASSLHRHFKQVTSMSPIQYQKQLRLIKARQLMLTENVDATNTAYLVGYESPSQFSREYARFFGSPPLRDIKRLNLQ